MRMRPTSASEEAASALHAEWVKLRTLAGTWWLLLGIAVLTAAPGAAVAAAVAGQGAGCGGQDPARIALSGVDLSQVVAAILAVLAVGGEYGTGLIRLTLTAVPRRTAVLAAKAAVVTALVSVAGAAGVLAAMLTGRLVLPGRGFTAAHGCAPLSLASGTDLRAAAGSVIYLALVALLALGVTAAVRDSAAATGLVLGLLYLFPVIAGALGPHWALLLRRAGMMTAGLGIQSSVGLDGLPLSPWAGLGVAALWAAAALLTGGALLCHRDA
jgi:ABC-2 type transport system permease protein